MEKRNVKVLLVEDDEDDILLIREYLRRSNYFNFTLETESNVDLAKARLLKSSFDLCLSDYRLGRFNGMELVSFVNKRNLRVPVILLTGQGGLEVDLEAMENGAYDYLIKNQLDSFTLEKSIRYSLSQNRIIRELDYKEKRYRSLFERSIDPIFLVNKEMHFMDVNSSLLQLFHYSREQLQHMKLSDLFDSRAEYENFHALISDLGHVKGFEITLKNQKGWKIPCWLNCVFIPDEIDPASSCFQGIIHDITMQKKIEQDRLMEEKLIMTGQIARTIAHEVRNPLTNLTLAFEQLKGQITANENVNYYTEIISRNARRINNLITELLSSSNRRNLDLKLVSVEEIIDETVQLIDDRINLNRMKLYRNIAEGLPLILADKEELKIALANICINAIEAMENDLGELCINGRQRSGQLIIEVLDNGMGIADDDLNKIFDPFFTGKKGGMGLGLTSTQNILKSHNANIEISSKVGTGTSVSVVFNLPVSVSYPPKSERMSNPG